MIFDGIVQQAGNTNFNYYSCIGSGFLPGNSFKTIVGFEISTLFVKMDGSSPVLSTPDNGSIFEKTSTVFWMNGYAKSKFGTDLLGVYFDYTTQKSKNKVKSK